MNKIIKKETKHIFLGNAHFFFFQKQFLISLKKLLFDNLLKIIKAF